MPGVKWEHGESPIATDIGELGYKVCGINYNVSNSCPARRLAKVCFILSTWLYHLKEVSFRACFAIKFGASTQI